MRKCQEGEKRYVKKVEGEREKNEGLSEWVFYAFPQSTMGTKERVCKKDRRRKAKGKGVKKIGCLKNLYEKVNIFYC
jgi:hypothetical protein